MGGEQKFIINNNAVTFIAQKLKKPEITNYLSKAKSEKVYNREELEGIIRTGLAIGAVRSKSAGPPIHSLISDDAPNIVNLTKSGENFTDCC